MTEKDSFIFEQLEKKSNAIVGFVVIQSLLLADKLSNSEFKEKLQRLDFIRNYLIYGHGIILLASIFFLFLINRKMDKSLGDLKKEIFSNVSIIAKICLVALFGFIPLYVLLSI